MKYDLQECLKEKNLRLTKVRKALLELFEVEPYPIAAPEIITLIAKSEVECNDSSIYRELHILSKKDVIRKVYLFNDKESYELSIRKHHHHIICAECECIEDIITDDIEEELLKLQRKIEKQSLFKKITHHLEFEGVCVQCEKK